MTSGSSRYGGIEVAAIFICISIIISTGIFIISHFSVERINYFQSADTPASAYLAVNPVASSSPVGPPPFTVTHIATPDPLHAVYFSSWAAGNKKFRQEMFNLLEKTEINAVVIDIKDYSGHISFPVTDPVLAEIGSAENRIPDIKEFIGELHRRGAYVIGRISAFQDSFLINVHPEWAVKTTAGNVWHDYKGVKWLDPGALPVWDYLVAIGKQSYEVGFDELNFDYMRYPSDGDLSEVSYSWSGGRTRTEVMREFFSYLHDQFASTSIPLSVDLFGLTTSATGDLGIGQVMENALPYFDYIDPMVYPSHFSAGFNGYDKPATKPYEVVKYSMDHASLKALNASSTPAKLRPWLQAFDLGAIYTPAMVRAQIQATYDSGLDSWLLWNAASEYNVDALAPKDGLVSGGSLGTAALASSTSM